MLNHPGVAFFLGEGKDQELPGLPGFLFNAFDGLRVVGVREGKLRCLGNHDARGMGLLR